MFNLFIVKDVNNKKHLMSANRIHKSVTQGFEDREYWRLNSKNLIDVCKKNGFPTNLAKDIKCELFDHFGMLLYCNDSILVDAKENLKAVCDLFNSTKKSKSKKIKDSRENFLKSYLEYVTNSLKHVEEYKRDPNYIKITNAWREKQFNRLIKKDYVDFYGIRKELKKDFSSIISFMIDAKVITKYDDTKKRNTIISVTPIIDKNKETIIDNKSLNDGVVKKDINVSVSNDVQNNSVEKPKKKILTK